MGCHVLGYTIKKGSHPGSWTDSALTPAQVQYACDDAWLSRNIGVALKALFVTHTPAVKPALVRSIATPAVPGSWASATPGAPFVFRAESKRVEQKERRACQSRRPFLFDLQEAIRTRKHLRTRRCVIPRPPIASSRNTSLTHTDIESHRQVEIVHQPPRTPGEEASTAGVPPRLKPPPFAVPSQTRAASEYGPHAAKGSRPVHRPDAALQAQPFTVSTQATRLQDPAPTGTRSAANSHPHASCQVSPQIPTTQIATPSHPTIAQRLAASMELDSGHHLTISCKRRTRPRGHGCVWKRTGARGASDSNSCSDRGSRPTSPRTATAHGCTSSDRLDALPLPRAAQEPAARRQAYGARVQGGGRMFAGAVKASQGRHSPSAVPESGSPWVPRLCTSLLQRNVL